MTHKVPIGFLTLQHARHSLVGQSMAAQPLRSTTRRSRSNKVEVPPLEIDLTATLDGLEVQFHWSLSGQHTLSWSKPVRATVDGVTTTLASGECNLYHYPAVKFRCVPGATKPVPQEGARLELLSMLMTAVATEASVDIFCRADASGATPTLALLVANSRQALDMCLFLYQARPSLLAQSHGSGPFIGENAFHVAAVNRREHLLCQMVELAHAHLDIDALREVLSSQATGAFFAVLPTANYGSTPLAYACCFCLKHAVTLMLSLSARSKKLEGILSLNDPKLACS
jgi:hypothetical protein